MALEWLTTPVSDDAPAGPDLDSSDDGPFVEYYFEAVGRLPEDYYVPGQDRPDGGRFPARYFDPKSVDLRKEVAEIEALLKRSRDVRLLVLKVQWVLLSGRLAPAVEAVEDIARLIETFGDAAHPDLAKSSSGRREALQDLTGIATVTQPLEYFGLAGGGNGTLRTYRAASGASAPREGEEDASVEGVGAYLSDPGAGETVTDNLRLLTRFRQALIAIAGLCGKNTEKPFTVDFAATEKVLAEMVQLVLRYRPDLASEAPEPETAAASDDPDEAAASGAGEGGNGAEAGSGDAPMPGAAPIPSMPALEIDSHAAARAALSAVEAYFARLEPSSAALLLVTQAKALIGMPLMKALEILLPQKAGSAVVSFNAAGLSIAAAQLKGLSDAAASQAGPDEPAAKAAAITSAGEAAAAIRGVETFFRLKERSSPVPMLLERARAYMEKDFQSLLAELIPAPPPVKEGQA